MIQSRPPVITIMGHVDHGKTSLLDYIRHSRVVAREAGGITQHIGAYQVEINGKKLTFIDTPGHAAFNKMRARGAQVTDFVVLVVAANDGVKPQTIESIRHIKEAGVPVVVAINKIDLPDVRPDLAKSQLAEHDLLVRDYGGEIEAFEVSAKTGKGVDALLEHLGVMADLQELKADPDAPLQAVVIESTRDPKRGALATVIVKEGTLNIRQDVFGDGITGKIRQLFDENHKPLVAVGPGSPAEILGLSGAPAVGSVLQDVARPAQIAEVGESLTWDTKDLADLFDDTPKLKLIIKADVHGSLEAIEQNLDTESTVLLRAGVGEITEDDVRYAEDTGATILAFHTRVPKSVVEMAKTAGVKIKAYDVIYHLLEELQKQMLKLMEPTIDETVVGEALVLQVFNIRGEFIAGCRVKTGQIKQGDLLHIKRGDQIVSDTSVRSIMQGKVTTELVKADTECGITFRHKKIQCEPGDIIVSYTVEE
jgi:translation initiation factor IF-2